MPNGQHADLLCYPHRSRGVRRALCHDGRAALLARGARPRWLSWTCIGKWSRLLVARSERVCPPLPPKSASCLLLSALLYGAPGLLRGAAVLRPVISEPRSSVGDEWWECCRDGRGRGHLAWLTMVPGAYFGVHRGTPPASLRRQVYYHVCYARGDSAVARTW
ncbi:hypothetical protein LY76DRAFT_113028 [Colletotrichum caudatum]|nr:hypothetical protein LY76DRAFT_113028 [Colletotrichum caudatum]